MMAVPHYDAEYGEPVATNMAAELGADVTTALQSADGLSHPLKQTLLSRAHVAAAQRDAFVDDLDTEADALASAAATYTACEDTIEDRTASLSAESYGSLAETRTQLQGLEADCETTLQKRQRQIQDMVNEIGPEEHESGESVSLPEYLYDSLDVSHPVLADGLSILETLREARRRVVGELATR